MTKICVLFETNFIIMVSGELLKPYNVKYFIILGHTPLIFIDFALFGVNSIIDYYCYRILYHL